MHEGTCDNYFAVKCLLKSNIARVILLIYYIKLAYYNFILTYYKQIDVKTATTNLTWLYFQTFDSFLFP